MATFPALKAQMGSTPYYVTTLTGRQLINTARAARDTDNWASLSIEDRMQREADLGRIRNQIVPYLAQHPDRFFGAVILLVEKDTLQFETLEDVVKDLPKAYKMPAEKLGFITDNGKGEHIVLDGQHRLLALRDVIQSGDDLGAEQRHVADDEITVIFVENTDPRKTRRIFNKVNRHAKPTGRADNILTSEDDGYAVLTRRLLNRDNDGPLAPQTVLDSAGEPVLDRTGKPEMREIVNWRSNTLSKTMKHLSTISAIYDNVEQIAKYEGYTDLNRIVSPNNNTLDKVYDEIAPWFGDMLAGLDAYKEALANPEAVPGIRFSSTHRHTLLLRPVGQIAVVRGIVRAMDLSRRPGDGEPRLTLQEAMQRVNAVDFSATSDSMWRDTIVRADGRMVARGEAYNLAAGLLVHLIAPEYETDELKVGLRRSWNKARGMELPDDLDETALPKALGTLEPLPQPVV